MHWVFSIGLPAFGFLHRTVQRAINLEYTVLETVLASSKAIIEGLARGVEFAAALIIGLAALEATVKALILFSSGIHRPNRRTKYA